MSPIRECQPACPTSLFTDLHLCTALGFVARPHLPSLFAPGKVEDGDDEEGVTRIGQAGQHVVPGYKSGDDLKSPPVSTLWYIERAKGERGK